MFQRSIVLVTLTLASTFAHGARPGRYRAPNATVDVKLSGDGYAVTIDVRGRASCLFEDQMTEVEEGDLRYSHDGCRLRVLQEGEDAASLSVHGTDACSHFCGAGAEIEIPRAVRR